MFAGALSTKRRTSRRRAPRATARRVNATSGRLGLCVTAIATCGLLVTVTAGALWIVVGAAALLLAAVLWTRPHLTIAALVIAAFLATSKAPLAGGLTLATAAGPARFFLLAVFAAQAAVLSFRFRVPALRVLLPAGPLLFVIALSLALSASASSSYLLAVTFGVLLVSSALIAWPLTSGAEGHRTFLSGLAIGYGTIVIVNVVLMPFLGSPFLAAAGGPRFEGIFESPNTVGLLGFAALPALVCAAISQPAGSAKRRFLFAVASLAAIEVLLSVSRAGLAGALVASAILVVGLTRRRTTVRIVLAVTTLGVVSLALGLGASRTVSTSLRLTTISQAGGRAAVAPRAVQSIRERPVLGHGYGSEAHIFQGFGPIYAFTGDYAGNLFLDVGLELGLLGLGTLLFAVAIPLLSIRRKHAASVASERRLATLASVAVVAGGLANAQGESFLLRPGGPGAPAFWLCLGLCSAEGVRRYSDRWRARYDRPSDHAPRSRDNNLAQISVDGHRAQGGADSDDPTPRPVRISERLRDLLRCPSCGAGLRDQSCTLVCVECTTSYGVELGIPRLVVPDAQEDPGFAFYNTTDEARYGRAEMGMPPQVSAAVRQFIDATPRDACVVEVGPGRGAFSGSHPGYVGVEYSWFAVRSYTSGQAIQASAEALPFADQSVDALFSIATLEHVPNPATALAEIDRCLRPGGRALLFPAWYVRPWAAKALATRAYRELPAADRVRKASIFLRDRRPYRFLRVLPGRLRREQMLRQDHTVPFQYRRLQPNLDAYLTSDSDAFSSMDPQAVSAYFLSRGYEELERPSVIGRLMYAYDPVVITKRSP